MKHRKRVSEDTRPRWWEIEEEVGEDEWDLLQQSCVRMAVFDAAPNRLRRRAREHGDEALIQWWSDLHHFEKIRILENARDAMRAREPSKPKWIWFGADYGSDD